MQRKKNPPKIPATREIIIPVISVILLGGYVYDKEFTPKLKGKSLPLQIFSLLWKTCFKEMITKNSQNNYKFIHSFSKYLLSASCVPDTTQNGTVLTS